MELLDADVGHLRRGHLQTFSIQGTRKPSSRNRVPPCEYRTGQERTGWDFSAMQSVQGWAVMGWCRIRVSHAAKGHAPDLSLNQ